MKITMKSELEALKAPDQRLIESAKPIRDILGGAEWLSPEHAEDILQGLIENHFLALSDALSTPTLQREKISEEQNDLESCPFCGNSPRIVEPHQSEKSLRGETDDEEWLSFVECDCVDMFFVKGSASSQEEARKSVVMAWNKRTPTPTRQIPKTENHVNGGAYRRISVDEWRTLGGDGNPLCDWHEGIGYVVYDDAAKERYRAKITALSTPTTQP